MRAGRAASRRGGHLAMSLCLGARRWEQASWLPRRSLCGAPPPPGSPQAQQRLHSGIPEPAEQPGPVGSGLLSGCHLAWIAAGASAHSHTRRSVSLAAPGIARLPHFQSCTLAHVPGGLRSSRTFSFASLPSSLLPCGRMTVPAQTRLWAQLLGPLHSTCLGSSGTIRQEQTHACTHQGLPRSLMGMGALGQQAVLVLCIPAPT